MTTFVQDTLREMARAKGRWLARQERKRCRDLRYNGAALRRLRAARGVGRPPRRST